jgi:hypothetical protein
VSLEYMPGEVVYNSGETLALTDFQWL